MTDLPSGLISAPTVIWAIRAWGMRLWESRRSLCHVWRWEGGTVSYNRRGDRGESREGHSLTMDEKRAGIPLVNTNYQSCYSGCRVQSETRAIIYLMLFGNSEQIAHWAHSVCSNTVWHVAGNISSCGRDLYVITLSKSMLRTYSKSVAWRTHYTKQWTELCTWQIVLGIFD